MGLNQLQESIQSIFDKRTKEGKEGNCTGETGIDNKAGL